MDKEQGVFPADTPVVRPALKIGRIGGPQVPPESGFALVNQGFVGGNEAQIGPFIVLPDQDDLFKPPGGGR